MKDYDLERFLKAQRYGYDQALQEIKNGKKQGHYIWYIFPQIKGMGRSYRARVYALESIDEAKSYLAHPVLGARLREISEALLKLDDNDPLSVMNGRPDDSKLHSSMTLFAYISEKDSVFHKVLEKFFAGQMDYKTISAIDYDDSNLTWDYESWLEKFNAPDPDYKFLRREVWESTRNIVEANKYKTPNGKYILLRREKAVRFASTFYDKEFRAEFEPFDSPPEISVVPDDCLDVAHRWINMGLDVSVLNMASRRNPGGGVINGSGAQEEYLFRCSDYYKFLYHFAGYAKEYNLKPSRHQYPLDKNFGGIYSPGVAIFRENESRGYKLADFIWKVNMIAVPGINRPELVIENGEELIAPNLIECVKNKIRTIFRIACDHGQRNLVLGALGCGAFRNPPRHVAKLFAEVLCEPEFKGAFIRICFAVKSDHNSNGDENYLAFKNILDGFIPEI